MASGGTVNTIVKYGIGAIGVYVGYSFALAGNLGTVMQGIALQLQEAFSTLPGTGGNGGGGGNGGAGRLTFEQACAAARSQLTALDGRWAPASCAQIRAEVCGNPTLFTGNDGGIRAAFGCPLY